MSKETNNWFSQSPNHQTKHNQHFATTHDGHQHLKPIQLSNTKRMPTESAKVKIWQQWIALRLQKETAKIERWRYTAKLMYLVFMMFSYYV
jgi:hypothetical protein